MTISNAELTAAAEELIRLNRQDNELHIVTFATPGPPDGAPTIGMRSYPVREERNRRWRESGVTLAPAINPHHPVGSAAIPFVSPTVKHRSRLAWWIAERANSIPGAIPVFFDHARQTFTETAIANLFAVKNGEVVSPPDELILDGITKRVVRELCQSLGVRQRTGTIATLRRDHWEELFLAGTGCDIVRVSAVAGESATFERSMSDRLIEAWSKLFK
jgi:branched-subunit amino acid aminotransferase/4-amino-4-deoxychorismate lyase